MVSSNFADAAGGLAAGRYGKTPGTIAFGPPSTGGAGEGLPGVRAAGRRHRTNGLNGRPIGSLV